ncbi:acyltransferase [Photobacterium sp. GB-27]|uniref:acyltransferase family protein n=1 Tax=Photobacterium sp. GB-27 TaxID=2022109 RepID=UPI000D173A17|nr:acyltransferase family protein [Photobacterium sp. GB-27]PSV30190.1 acyltransferase [Photobacterium sp. GB-27]
MKFRTDINGLRALAVIAVVLFHFNPSWVPGGFAGVDVFFVISGFLMTGIIFRGLENNSFSIINFYVARANRIIPALSVVCLALLIFGWFYLTPLDYRALGKHVASSMGFVSNIIYWRESGYFDAVAHSKWLLHTWSLSVEWQFYMIYPVVLVLLKKCISLTNIKRLLIVGTVIGFIFSAYATYRWPNPAYFLLPTRAWEMMMGGLAFLYPLQNIKETSKKYLEWVGIALILASYAFISKDNLWPGYLALIPVLGAYLIIIANRNGSVITDNVVMQKVGLWSYSIYLWHWPVVVFGYYFEMQHWEWIGIPLSVILGFCSYKLIEKVDIKKLSTLYFLIVTSSFLIFLLYNNKTQNLSFNQKANDLSVWRIATQYNKLTDFDKKEVLVIGDSQAADITRIYDNYKDISLVQRTVYTECGIPYLENGVISNYPRLKENPHLIPICKDQMKRLKRFLKENNVKKIFVGYLWRDANLAYIDNFIKSLKKLTDAQIVIFGNKNLLSQSSYNIIKLDKNIKNGLTLKFNNDETVRINKEVEKITLNNAVSFFDFKKILCKSNGCLVTLEQKPLFYDATHFTPFSPLQLSLQYRKVLHPLTQ